MPAETIAILIFLFVIGPFVARWSILNWSAEARAGRRIIRQEDQAMRRAADEAVRRMAKDPALTSLEEISADHAFNQRFALPGETFSLLLNAIDWDEYLGSVLLADRLAALLAAQRGVALSDRRLIVFDLERDDARVVQLNQIVSATIERPSELMAGNPVIDEVVLTVDLGARGQLRLSTRAGVQDRSSKRCGLAFVIMARLCRAPPAPRGHRASG